MLIPGRLPLRMRNGLCPPISLAWGQSPFLWKGIRPRLPDHRQKKSPPKRGVFSLVPRRGLEPPRFYPLVPETSASTNSATWATQEMNYGERQKMCQQHFTLFSGAARPGDAAGCASPVTVVSTRQSMRTGVVAPTHRRAVRRRCACCADAGARWSAARCRRRCRGRP